MGHWSKKYHSCSYGQWGKYCEIKTLIKGEYEWAWRRSDHDEDVEDEEEPQQEEQFDTDSENTVNVQAVEEDYSEQLPEYKFFRRMSCLAHSWWLNSCMDKNMMSS